MSDDGSGWFQGRSPAASFPANWLCPLPELGLLSFSGADAVTFLQGQTTCDVIGLPSGGSTLGALCNPKGRVIALFRAFKWDGGVFLVLPRAQATAVLNRLRMYVLRSKVQIEDVGAEWLCLGCGGSALAAALAGIVSDVPVESDGVAFGPGCVIIRAPSLSDERALVIARADVMKGVCDGLAVRDFALTTSDRWLLEDIRSGVPSITDETSEAFVPQMLNLDILGGISFTKGCYTGQEVVARTRYLGVLKRRMYRFGVDDRTRPATPGTPIYAAHEDQAAGMVVCRASDADGHGELLAVVNCVQAERGNLRLHTSIGAALIRSSLPYSIPIPADQESTENGSEK